MQHLGLNERRAVLAALTSAVTVESGPTAEQQRLLDILATHVLLLDEAPDAMTPAAAAAALTDDATRRMMIESLIVLELTCHPASAALVERVGTYITAFGGTDDEQAIARDYVAGAKELIAEDWARTQEPSSTEASVEGADETEIGRRLQALGDCAPGTMGRSFHDFYDRHGFALPIDHVSLIGHDFAHVLAGYEATPEGELALQAMLVAACEGTRHFSGLLASLLLFEVGMLPFPDIEPKEAVLDRPGAAELFTDAIVRGVRCGRDFQDVDHLAWADRDLADVRTELGIPAPTPGPFTFSA